MADRTREIKDILWLFALAGAVAITFRLWYGLGATTHLSDQVPWGLWKILNMVAGVALSTGGFMVGFLVYVLKMRRFRSLVKPAILIAFLGYGSSGFALLMDIGLPHRFWHPIVMWNDHSFLFEVTWCVMLYFTVTMIELSPTVLERLRIKGLASLLRRVAPGVVIVGISLSCLHHSSLGSLFLVTPQRLHPLWYSALLPLHFIVSAMGAGLMVVVLAKMLYARLYDPESVFEARAGNEGGLARAVVAGDEPHREGRDMPMLRQLSVIACGFLGAELVLRVADLFRTGAARYIMDPTWETWLYSGELLLLCVVPMVLVAFPVTRRSPAGLGLAAASTALGLVLGRLNVGIFGYFRDAGSVYAPSFTEWIVSLGVIASAGLIFLYLAENCAVFDDQWKERLGVHRRFYPSFDKFSGVWYRALRGGLPRVTLLAVLVVPVTWMVLYPPFLGEGAEVRRPVAPVLAQDVKRAVLRIVGNGAMPVVFKHADHIKRLGGEESCGKCHHISIPRDHSTPCYRCHRDSELATRIFSHTAHLTKVAKSENLRGAIPANSSCAQCHPPGLRASRRTSKPCMECHRKDMAPSREPPGPWDLMTACGYRQALHDTCIPCHRKEAPRLKRPELSECRTCHAPDKPAIARTVPPALQAMK
jgi:Ni/Fe-hydrogenase subunit HybB-like protein